MAAMTGLLRSNNSVNPAKPPAPKSASGASPSAAAFKSQPAQKNRSPAPVIMATRKLGSSRKRINTSPISWLVLASIALAFGLSNIISSTEPRVVRCNDWLMSYSFFNKNKQL